MPRLTLYKPSELRKLVKKLQPDYIIHLAAYGNKYEQKDERKMMNANIVATMNLLEASKEVPYKAFINTGSSSEYGTKRKPMKETDSLDTTTFYGATKASQTILCRAFATKYHKPVVTARPFSLYGDGDDPKHFIPTVIRCFVDHETLNLAPGVHDWIHVEDYIKGVLLICQNADKLQGQVVNVGTNRQTDNDAIVWVIKNYLGVPVDIKVFNTLRDYDTDRWMADNTLLKSLGWQQDHTLEDDLERMTWEYKTRT